MNTRSRAPLLSSREEEAACADAASTQPQSGYFRFDPLRLVPMSADDLVVVLARAGFARASNARLDAGESWIWMHRAGTSLRVRVCDVIPIEELVPILRIAELGVAEVLEGLDAIVEREGV